MEARAHHGWSRRSLLVLAAVASTLALAACTMETETDQGSPAAPPSSQATAASETPQGEGVDLGTPASLHVEARPPTQAILVYSVPPADPTKDGTVFARVVDPKTGAAFGEDRLVGSFTQVEPVYSNSPDASTAPWIMTASVLGEPPLEEFILSRGGASLARSVSRAEASDRELAGPTAVEAVGGPGGARYRATERGVTGTDASGAVAQARSLPRALPITSQPTWGWGANVGGLP